MNLTDLKAAVADRPELLAQVNDLDKSRHRLTRLLFDLGRLDEALSDRVLMFDRLRKSTYPPVQAIAENCQQLLLVVISFINHASVAPEDKAKSAAEVFDDLMKRM